MGGPLDVEGSPVGLRATERRCGNCGANALGTYCPDCGQLTRERLPTFAEFMREASGRYVALDGKLWKTLFALLFRPGFLTREYLAGRRRRYVGPARLFLVSSLVLFAVLRFASESMNVDDLLKTEAHDDAAPTRNARDNTPARAGSGEKVAVDDDLHIDLRSLAGTSALGKRLDRFNQLPRSGKIEQVVGGVLRYGPYAMFVLLPAFALLLKLAYVGRGRRHPSRPRLYGEHLVFAAHDHAYLFAALALAFVVPQGAARGLVVVWMLVYLLWSVRTVYGGAWLGIVARAVVLMPVYLILFGLATAGLLIAAIVL